MHITKCFKLKTVHTGSIQQLVFERAWGLWVCIFVKREDDERTHTLASLRTGLSSPLRCLELLLLLCTEVEDWLSVRLRPWCSDLGVRCSVIEGEGADSFSLSWARLDELQKTWLTNRTSLRWEVNCLRFTLMHYFSVRITLTHLCALTPMWCILTVL